MSHRNLIIAFGGMSPEHEVSVLTAMQAIASLRETSYKLIPLYISKSGRWLTGEMLLDLESYRDLDKLQKEATPCTFSHDDLGKPVLLETKKSGLFSKPASYPIHAVIPAFHGSEGENGAFQGTCEMYNIPFAGSGVFASSLGMDKVKAKELCRAHDFPVVEEVAFEEKDWEQRQETLITRIEALDYPVIVKPVTLGSSIGVAKATDKKSLIDAVETAFRYDERLMVEQAVHPLMEVNCSVRGNSEQAEASVCERPIGTEETLSFKDKYQSGDSDGGGKGMASADRVIPADISDELTREIQSMAVSIFKAFRAAGLCRIDFLVNADTKQVYFNEINTIPGSFSFYLWKENGVSMKELMLGLVETARQAHQKKLGRIRSYDTNLLSEKAVRGMKGLKGSKNQA